MSRARVAAAAVAYTGLAIADSMLAGRPGNARRLRVLTKPLLMPALATAFIEATPGRTDLARRATLTAQTLSWGGDVALLGAGERWFLAGLGSFFTSHVGYLVAFSSVRRRRPGNRRGGEATMAVWMITAPVITFAAGRQQRELAAPVAAYTTVLAAMTGVATLVDPNRGPGARRAIVAGASLFLVSDLILGTRKFLLGDRLPGLEHAVMATYTVGQGLIALGVAQLNPSLPH